MAVSLNGSTDYVLTTVAAPTAFDRTDPFSLSIWAYCTSNTAPVTGTQSLMRTCEMGGTFRGFTFDRDNTSERMSLLLISTFPTHMAESTATSTTLPLNTWTHLIVTYDGSSLASGINIYFNGVAATMAVSFDTLDASMVTTQPLYIGSGDPFNFFPGLLADARVYNRVLSLAEVQTIYSTLGKDAFITGLVGRWPMNEQAAGVALSGATSVKDLRGVNDGGPVGSPVYATDLLTSRRRSY